jgi:excisionase family DNA binding protein
MSEEPKKELEILWTPMQVARYLGLNPVTVYRWVSEKRMLDPAKIIRFSNRVRIPRSEVERIAGLVRTKIENKVPTLIEPENKPIN